MCEALQPMIDKVWRYCETSHIHGRTVTLKVKFADFEVITKSRTQPVPIDSRDELTRLSLELLAGIVPVAKGIRLLGVTISSLNNSGADDNPQMELAL
jgi:DNA polymerase-4